MPHFPMFVDLKGKRVVIIGGGAVALRKAKRLTSYDADIEVIAPDVLQEIYNLSCVHVKKRNFQIWDLWKRPELVVTATDDKKLNHKIAERCHKRRIPVNVADDPSYCTFLFPAVIQQGNFSAGICTSGSSPSAAAYFKNQFRQCLPENLEELLEWLEDQRAVLKEEISEEKKRNEINKRLFDAVIKKGDILCEEERERCKNDIALGKVTLVGAGCGKEDLITIRGMKRLQECQAVVFDDLIDKTLLEYAPESAEKIYVGKRKGIHYKTQEEINEVLIRLAKEGKNVVRLKGGDPYLFGRGGEEMLALQKEKIFCEEVPGISSAIGIPAEYGIPVTHRGVSQSLHIMTAHTAEHANGLPEDFQTMAKLSGTLVFLMGLSKLPEIVEGLVAGGMCPDTPAAVLSGGNSDNPKEVRATLETIETAVREEEVSAPAIIVVGEVAAIQLKKLI